MHNITSDSSPSQHIWDSVPDVITAHSLPVPSSPCTFGGLPCLFGRFNQCSIEAKSFSRDPPDSEMPESGAKKMAVKSFFPPMTARKPQSLRTLTVCAAGSDVATYLIHVVNCGVFLCSCHQLFSVFHATCQLSLCRDDHPYIQPKQISLTQKLLWTRTHL